MYDLGLSDDQFWRLTPGQFYKLCDRKNISDYYGRFDIAALHASFLSAFGSRTTAKALIGKPPILSDQTEEVINANELVKAFRQIFPQDSGSFGDKKKGKVKRTMEPRK